jgi:hypothetical protein
MAEASMTYRIHVVRSNSRPSDHNVAKLAVGCHSFFLRCCCTGGMFDVSLLNRLIFFVSLLDGDGVRPHPFYFAGTSFLYLIPVTNGF